MEKDTELRKRLEGLAAADLVDALAKTYEHRTHIIDLTSPDPNKVLFGRALTVGFLPVRKDLMDPHKHSMGPMIYRAVADDDLQGRVLVVASNGYPEISLGGSTKFSRLVNNQMAGLLCDGSLRDFDDLANYPVAIYCKGETTRTGGNLIQPYLANVPIKVDEVTVVPGDYIYADKTGAVVIPANDIEKVIDLAHKILNMAKGMLEKIKQENPEEVLSQGSMEA